MRIFTYPQPGFPAWPKNTNVDCVNILYVLLLGMPWKAEKQPQFTTNQPGLDSQTTCYYSNYENSPFDALHPLNGHSMVYDHCR